MTVVSKEKKINCCIYCFCSDVVVKRCPEEHEDRANYAFTQRLIAVSLMSRTDSPTTDGAWLPSAHPLGHKRV